MDSAALSQVLAFATLLVTLISKVIWPLTVLAVVWVFREPFKTLLRDVAEVKWGDATFTANRSQRTGEGSLVQAPRPGPHPDDAPYRGIIEGLRASEWAAGEPAEQVEKLLSLAARLGASWSFERVYQFIYGSQLAALDWLNTTSPSPTSILRDAFYKRLGVDRDEEFYKGYPFEWWLQFLTSWNLVTVSGEEVSISDVGRLFLQYLTQQGLAKEKLR